MQLVLIMLFQNTVLTVFLDVIQAKNRWCSHNIYGNILEN